MRRVPTSLAVKLVLGGSHTRFAWLWVAIVCWGAVVFLSVDLDNPTYTHEDVANIDRVEETRHEGTTQYLAHYSYKDEDGYNRGDTSLASERPALGPHPLELSDNGLSRLVGMKRAPPEVPTSHVLFLVAVGLLFMVFEVPAGLRRLRFVRHAQWREAVVTDVEPPLEPSKPSLMTLKLDDTHGKHTACVPITHPGSKNVSSLFVLHDVRGPGHILTSFDFPQGTLQSDGTLAGSVAYYRYLLPPAAALTGLLTLLVLKL